MRRSIYLTYRSGYLIPGIHPSQELIPTKISVLGDFPSWMPIIRSRIRNFSSPGIPGRYGKYGRFCPDCLTIEKSSEFENGVCMICARDYVNCERCGTRTHESDSSRILAGESDEVLWCDWCARNHAWDCENCGVSTSMRTATVDNNRDYWCSPCASENLNYCDDCDVWYRERDCPNCEEEDLTRSESNRIRRGVRTDRFTLRPVGLEIETGHGGSSRDFLAGLPDGWGVHADGSLHDDAMELVSPPIAGNCIERDLRQIYRRCAKYDVSLQDNRAGFHVHVNARGIYGAIAYAGPRSGDRRESRAMQWGEAAVYICRQFVSIARMSNAYCAGGFAIRGCGHYSLKKCPGHTYPTVAVRDSTIEFRLWPSTNNIEFHLARIELSQKLVGVLDRAVRNNRGTTPELKQLWRLASYFRVPLKPLAKLLKLSDQTLDTLTVLQNKYDRNGTTKGGAA